jgi:hypothetical protein
MPKPPDPKGGEIFAWGSVGWYVAFLIGIWGALMGTGDYSIANCFFLLAAVIFCIKAGHIAEIHRKSRSIISFSLAVLAAAVFVGVVFRWTAHKAIEAARQREQLAKLDLVPALQEQVKQIPSLQKQIDSLKKQNNEANSTIQTKEDTVERLARALTSQLGRTETNLSANINQYRTDTTTAVARLIQPDRHLTPAQRNEIHRAYLSSFCSLPDKEQTEHIGGVSILWEPNGEAAEYASEFIEALKTGCGYFGYRSELRAAGRQIMGLILITKDWDHPSPIASAIPYVVHL